MPRWFNTAGPCEPDDHYMLPAFRRLPEVHRLIDQKSYFVLHAPRQVGKTTALSSLARELTAQGRYVSVLVSMELGAAFQEVGAAESAVLQSWREDIRAQLPPELQPPPFPEAPPGSRISAALSAWAESSSRPVVVFLDEIDALRNDVLLSVLRQLRDGYRRRPEHFPASLALIGLRDVRDYKVTSGERGHLGTTSPFNIKVESLTLRNFTRDEVAELYAQHTSDTGQVFLSESIDRAFYWTQGQPWLVNALARQMVEQLVPDPSQALTAAHVDAAKEILLRRQDTHLDSLAERLREPRVRRILEPLLAGLALGEVPADDLRFVQDLGLVRLAPTGGLEVANPLYREVIPRVLANTAFASLPPQAVTWLRADGRLDTERLMEAFLAFWRQHGQPLLGTAPYHEIAPHLVLMAFLHRVANGGGTLEREYAIGTGRMDLCLRHGPDTLALELKVWRDGEKDPLDEGLAQLDGYLAGLGLGSGWLVIFDRRSGQPPIAERTRATAAASPSGRQVSVVRA
ncbi:ATP-binding protein [Vitiosangium sp. GDMCC 1.1324]|uniref:ATP-binding protein n=1 Tax=Vitiosangium sp. (strain GDMCC 1.1324) TaxID=2138576 RepID=UPI000D3D9C05|nr:ATP-binding protein [Vitiosangium sp. GDMCC 1.1324]PTL83445.1 polyketide biosynthesis operon protein CyrO [Vitiosangium sp. GDMCC 1.1324]